MSYLREIANSDRARPQALLVACLMVRKVARSTSPETLELCAIKNANRVESNFCAFHSYMDLNQILIDAMVEHFGMSGAEEDEMKLSEQPLAQFVDATMAHFYIIVEGAFAC